MFTHIYLIMSHYISIESYEITMFVEIPWQIPRSWDSKALLRMLFLGSEWGEPRNLGTLKCLSQDRGGGGVDEPTHKSKGTHSAVVDTVNFS